jgi:hypothetical protein
MIKNKLAEQLQTALDWMRDANNMPRRRTARGLLCRIGTREIAEQQLETFFAMVEQNML